MPIVGFNYNKISVEKKQVTDPTKNIQIKSNVTITDVKEEKLPTGKQKSDGLKLDFEFSLEYEPEMGHINLSGFIYYMEDPKVMKTIFKDWQKDKKLPQEVTGQVINTILLKSNIKALYLSQEVNLPPHIQMPRVVPKDNKAAEEYIG